jgi:hypothetical protein
MGMTPSQVRAMDHEEYRELRAYFEIEPPGTQGMELLLAQLCQIVAVSGGAKNIDLEHLMPYSQNMKQLLIERQTPEQQLADMQQAIKGKGYEVI